MNPMYRSLLIMIVAIGISVIAAVVLAHHPFVM